MLNEKLWQAILCHSDNKKEKDEEAIRKVAACLQPEVSSEAGGQDVSYTLEQLRKMIEQCTDFLWRATNDDPENKIRKGIDDMQGLL